jgi:NADH dehydrogenase
MAEPRRVVVIGCGFGGLSVAEGLKKSPVALTVIDQHNYHMFQPLLYQVATAGLSPADIAHPIRGIVGRQPNTRVLLGRVTGVDTAARVVLLDSRRVPYDTLVISTGALQSYFGHDEWEKVAPGLKRLEDALAIRRKLLMAFERAEATDFPDERRRLLNFVVVGGGPTGVELAGAIAELARMALVRDFRTINPAEARIVLIEAGPRVLPSFPEDLAQAAKKGLADLGVEVRTGAMVTACDADGVQLGDERIEARTVIWSAGVKASPAAAWLGIDADKQGRIAVGADLTVPGHPEIYVIGDTASVAGKDGKPLPGVAPVAKQEGNYVARRIHALATGRPVPSRPFRYVDYGDLATIGRGRAVIHIGPLKLSGHVAWVIWGIAHIFFLIGFRNRLAVVMSWIWAYVTFGRGVRLITD